MEIYFDNSATTQCTPQVCEAVADAMRNNYGNPSSAHRRGLEAEQLLRKSLQKLAATLRCSEKEIILTSGGTESDNMALIGGALANRRCGNHLITSAVEHPAISNTMQFLEKNGFRVTTLGVDRNGRIRLDELKDALCDDTILVSLMYVNNENGVIEPVEEAASIVKSYRESILFHTDAVQAYGKLRILPQKTGIDLISASGHKIHGPKGTGFLYMKEHTKLFPLMYGGGQMGGMRSGTVNVPGAAGLAAAAEESCRNLAENTEKILQVRNCLEERIRRISDTVILSPEEENIRAPHILNAAFPGIRSEVLLHALEAEEIYVSAGSACSTHKQLPVSPVLTRMGIEREIAQSALRFSFSSLNTVEEAMRCADALDRLVPKLRRYTRR